MSALAIAMIIIFVATFVGLVKYQDRPEQVFALSALACVASSLVSVEEVLHNSVNTGVVTLLLLVVCSFAIERTSFLRKASSFLINKNKKRSLVKLLATTALSSAFMNNTAVVASLITPIRKNKFISPGKLLLPVSYAAMLGGTLTLVGTSTNLMVNSLAIEQGHVGFKFFDFTLVGAVAAIICISLIALTAKFLPETAVGKHKEIQYFLEAKVTEDSELIGLSIEENGLRNLESLFLVEVSRDNRLIAPVSPDTIIRAGDTLIFTGDIKNVLVLQQFSGLTLFAEETGLLQENLTEVVIKPNSTVVGKTLKTAGFRARFDAAVVAIRRDGSKLSGKLGEIVIQSGDFLVLAVGNDFSRRSNLSKNFFVLSGVQPKNMLSGWRDKAVLYGFIATVVGTLALSIPLLTGLIFFVAFLVTTKCLAVNEIKRRFPLEIWAIVVGALVLADGMQNSGIAQIIADNIGGVLIEQSGYLALVVIFLVTLILTELITNSAAAALIFPIAYSVSLGLDLNPTPFMLAVAFAASGSFISPYGYQTNVMVYNAGQYKIKDFVRYGVPISITYCIVILIMLPIVFPFRN